MAKNRNECVPYNVQNINDDRRFFVKRCEIMKVTKMAKAWGFTCSFCPKKFSSAQAMAGHQNAHRSERLGERMPHLKCPTGHWKKTQILSIKEAADQAMDLDIVDGFGLMELGQKLDLTLKL